MKKRHLWLSAASAIILIELAIIGWLYKESSEAKDRQQDRLIQETIIKDFQWYKNYWRDHHQHHPIEER